MKIILDTNVFISGVFFGGLPYQILDAWRNGKLDIVLSEDIFNEYQRVAHELSKQFKEVAISTFLDLLTVNAIWVEAPKLPFNVSADPTPLTTPLMLIMHCKVRTRDPGVVPKIK